MKENLECERKFLAAPELLPNEPIRSELITQVYLLNSPKRGWETRIRFYAKDNLTVVEQQQIEQANSPEKVALLGALFKRAVLTDKRNKEYAVRYEEEQDLAIEEACSKIDQSRSMLIKRRSVFIHAGKEWEVDTYITPFPGLTIAEVEMPYEELSEPLDIPQWCREEVTGDDRYSNASIAMHH